MKRQNSVTMREALSMWIDSMKLRQQIDEKRLIMLWKPTVGDYMAARTKEIYIKNRTLFVYVDSSVVRNELVLAKALLLKRLNSETGGSVIDDIIFR